MEKQILSSPLQSILANSLDMPLLHVTKRDGSTIAFDEHILSLAAKQACAPYPHLEPERIVHEAKRTVFDGITTKELAYALALGATTLIELDPDYTFVAAQLFLLPLHKEVFGQKSTPQTHDGLYRAAFKSAIHTGIELKKLDPRMATLFDLDALTTALHPERDLLFGYIGLQTLHGRYLLRHKDKHLELPQIFWMRIAMGLSLQEDQPTTRAIQFYNVLSTLRFVSSTPTLFNAGTVHPQLSSCYLTYVPDDLEKIFKCLKDNALLSKWSGGLGNSWTSLRGTGAAIKSIGITGQGTVPFLKLANDVVAAINRVGSRRGATCAYLEAWHYDFEDFLDLRRNTGDERRRTHDMNTASWIPDLFMKRVINNEPWTLFSPDETPDLHEIYGKAFEAAYMAYEEQARQGKIKLFKTIDAQTLWRKMLSRLFETGHPWITFKDPCNVRSPQDHAGVIHSSNLCTEITLNTSTEETAVCNLGSINLGLHVKDGALNKELLADTVHTAVRMLDNVIDINFYPTIEAKNANMRHRPIGLGLMGLQDALFMLDISFSSKEALAFCDTSMEFISYHAIMTSSELAKERGAYQSFKGSKWDRNLLPLDTIALLEEQRGMPINVSRTSSLDWTPVREHIQKHGMRNSNTMAIAPTATIANIAGCYPCIEPLYKNIYVKSNMSGEFTVVNAYLVAELKQLGLWNQAMLDLIKYHDGSIQQIAAIPAHLKAKYLEAFELDPEWMIALTAARSKWIDQSQSHNVFIKGTSGKKLNDTYLAAWQAGLKTLYYLRSLGASQAEKTTLDSGKFGLTQKRTYTTAAQTETTSQEIAACALDKDSCESCQ